MKEYVERHRRMMQYRQRVIDNLHSFAFDWQESGGLSVSYQEFRHFLLPEGVMESQNEKTGDCCYIHRLKTREGILFKTITLGPIDFSRPF